MDQCGSVWSPRYLCTVVLLFSSAFSQRVAATTQFSAISVLWYCGIEGTLISVLWLQRGIVVTKALRYQHCGCNVVRALLAFTMQNAHQAHIDAKCTPSTHRCTMCDAKTSNAYKVNAVQDAQIVESKICTMHST